MSRNSRILRLCAAIGIAMLGLPAAARVGSRSYDVQREDGSGLQPGPDLDPMRPVRVWSGRGGSYSPAVPPTAGEEARYAGAVELYRESEFASAVLAFDSIASDPHSPYRAAAAYSAARARILQGQMADGIRRIGSLLADPSLAEFHGAARHLVGTLSYQSHDDARLRAAKYAQMLELGFPAKPACTDEVAAAVQREELSDLEWYLDMYRGGSSKFRVLDELSSMDARFDVLRALAMLSPHVSGAARGRSFSWPEGKPNPAGGFEWNVRLPVATAGTGGAIEWLTTPEQRAVTAHARERWLATRNYLWALAFAQRALDAADAPVLVAMINGLDKPTRPEISAEARTALRLHFLRQVVRLHVQQGRADQALALIERERAHLRLDIPVSSMPSYIRDPRDRLALDVLEAAIVHYLRRMEFQAAHAWTLRVRSVGGDSVGRPWQLLLARNFSEALKTDGSWDSIHRLSQLGPVFDWQPVRTMLKLARDPATPSPARRALVGAAWVRLFALERTNEWWVLLPELGKAFPELAADIDALSRTQGAENRRYRAALMLLANPGIGILPSRLHEFASYYNSARPDPRPLTQVDSHNPSDGNWWCALGPEYLKRELVVEMYLGPTSSAERGRYVWAFDRSTDFYTNTADQLLARHPLLTGISHDELQQLGQIPSGVAQLATIVFARESARFRSNASKEDRELMAKALHDIVRATRYGCRRQGSMAALSREAYRRLHHGYADSSWAKRTRYWYDYGYVDPRMPEPVTRGL